MNKYIIQLVFVLVIVGLAAMPVFGSEEAGDIEQAVGDSSTSTSMPTMNNMLDLIEKATSERSEGADLSTPIKLVIIFAGLAILPSLMIMMTSFTRIIIVLSFIRRALSTQSIPPTVAIVGLALFLTVFTMAPTFSQINDNAIAPYLNDEIDFEGASIIASASFKEFMLKQCRKADLGLFVEMAKAEMPENPLDLPMHIVVPTFVISEFRTAFEIGCLLFIPFLLIDLVIASILLSAGMMMLPPAMISLPFKLVLFILVDGWGLLAKSLSMSFH